jgi:hypothetical protein
MIIETEDLRAAGSSGQKMEFENREYRWGNYAEPLFSFFQLFREIDAKRALAQENISK